MSDTRIHPALLERLNEMAGGIPLAEAFAAVDARGPDDLPAVMRYIVVRRRAEGTVPRSIPISNRRGVPDWLCSLAGEATPDSRRSATWPETLLESPLEREPNPFMRLYLALALRSRDSLTPPRRWRWFIQVLRLLVLVLMVWLSDQGAGRGIALLVALVAGLWMLVATPHVSERIARAVAVVTFNDALEDALDDDVPPDDSLSHPSTAP
ncbi:MAG: hypothetical protein P8174_07450 [Gemmatimonadota bacterium]|jgi:hypothetical protein